MNYEHQEALRSLICRYGVTEVLKHVAYIMSDKAEENDHMPDLSEVLRCSANRIEAFALTLPRSTE